MESPSRIEGKLFAALSCFRYAGTSVAGGSIAFLLLAVTAPDAVAKCSVRSYTISGLVVDSTGVPARGALVGVSWIQQARPAGPAFSVADEYGRYSIPLRFDTYSGYSLRGDRCDGELMHASVSAYTLGGRSDPVLVSIPGSPEVSAPSLRISASAEW